MPPKKKTTKQEPPPSDALRAWKDAIKNREDWFDALLVAISRWEVAEETVDGRHYCYLIAGEAFDWLLLAERLCEEADGAIPADEREALLFFGRFPRSMNDIEFKRAIGDAKHRAHLNFLYGVAVEEALQLAIEEEILKEHRSCGGWTRETSADEQVFERVYGRSRVELLAAFKQERSLPPGDELSYGELNAFTYWLFKYRVDQSDPARVGSDTRKALAQISVLQAAGRRRNLHLANAGRAHAGVVVDGEVVAHIR